MPDLDPQDNPYIPNAKPFFDPTPPQTFPNGGQFHDTGPAIGAPMNFLDDNVDAPVWTSSGAQHAASITNGPWNPTILGQHPQGPGPQSDLVR